MIVLVGLLFFYLIFDQSSDVNDVKSKNKTSNVKQSNNKNISKSKSSVEIIEKFYENGNIKSKISMLDGQKHGESQYFFKDGKLKAIKNYKNGNRHGEFITYLNNGDIKKIVHWENNKVISTGK